MGHKRLVRLFGGARLDLRIAGRHPDDFPRGPLDSRRHVVRRRRVHPAIRQIHHNAAEELDVRHLLPEQVSQGCGGLEMVLEHQSTQATHTRHPHFRDIRLLAGPGRGGRVHVKVHVDGSPEQPGAVSLPAGFTGERFLEVHEPGEHRQ